MTMLYKVETAFKLGPSNLARIAKYRLSLKSELNPLLKLSANMPNGAFYGKAKTNYLMIDFPKTVEAFGHLTYVIADNYPNWSYNPLTKTASENTKVPWYQIPDFDQDIGDVKGVWEASRFDWIVKFLTQKTPDESKLALIDAWINNWCENNPAYMGPNWKCGQEASIRVMHLIGGLIVTDQLDRPSANILNLIEIHLKRIAPTIDYAIAQDNNHGTSEATALFIGGALLNSISVQDKYFQWMITGRKWLENRAKRLIMADGGFSQYSVNYHRVMLDSYSLAECCRDKLGLSPFSKTLYQQLQKATDWLYIMTQDNGDVPNLGANDGAHLFAISGSNYRDFRPSVQLASTLFNKKSYYKLNGNYDNILSFFRLEKCVNECIGLPNKNQLFKQSGLITAQNNVFFLAFKLPIFRFRPSQCDALHLDVWCDGKNILLDGGTFSYNSTPEDLDYFSGVASHNTVQFDSHQQMPRISRFLFGAWLKPMYLKYQENTFSCAYKDHWQCEHHREIKLENNQIAVKDTLAGFKQQAILRWRLQPDNWQIQDNQITNGDITLTIQSSELLTIRLVSGEESRYYYQKNKLPVLEVTVTKSTVIYTIIEKNS